MSKGTTDAHRVLDVRRLHREKRLEPGSYCRWEWAEAAGAYSLVEIRVDSRMLIRLSYQLQHQRTEMRVPITWTTCHLGGQRPWFDCPSCERRVAKLYGSTVFACRRCLRLNYRSQQASKRERPAERSRQLRRTLGCSKGVLCLPAELIQKPKGMHWRTFDKRIAQIKEADELALGSALATLGSLESKLESARNSLARCKSTL